jgi:acyl-CoA synthetase (AMP-forming)/AMP-acid ligase II
MTTAPVFRLWLGRPAHFRLEVNKLVELLGGPLIDGDIGLILSPEQREGFDWIGKDQFEPDFSGADNVGRGYLGLMTSGTTGLPKLIAKHYGTLLDQKQGHGGDRDRWLLCYSPGRWAGISVLAHALKTRATLVVPEDLSTEAILNALPDCTHVGFTPSFFRKLCASAGGTLTKYPVRQVTFGGEYATQSLLELASRIWPSARITHIYASTEFGDICAVSDRMEGIPVSSFKAGWSLNDDGEFCIGGNGTGDLWEVQNGRLIFVGRKTDTINVGGAKVSPNLVERAALSIAGVTDCRAYAIQSPLLGQVVAMEYCGTIDAKILRRELVSRLPRYAVPISYQNVHEISLTAAGKISRIRGR